MATTQVADKRPIEVRAAEPTDRRTVLRLLAASLGLSSDERFAAFFDWKHAQNPFGRSPAWVATDAGEVVGFRTFMRWEHRAASGAVLSAVRAVDTATHPSHQGRGIFRRLTLQALDDLRAQGVAFVFNTPNERSRPGYLKMGWTAVGRLDTGVRVRSVATATRLARSRVPADLWSAPSDGGRPAADVLADPGVADLLASAPRPSGLTTHRTPEYLRWRYGFAPLAYRAVTLDEHVRSGLAVFRLRHRGRALECVLCDVIAPAGDQRAPRALVRTVTRACGADYVIRLGGPAVDRNRFVRAPGQGPVLTWYALSGDPPGYRLDDWALTLGDVELF
ncbi:MAG: GNAT family N-acetyltransferase [Acidimicrobiales bacterium]